MNFWMILIFISYIYFNDDKNYDDDDDDDDKEHFLWKLKFSLYLSTN